MDFDEERPNLPDPTRQLRAGTNANAVRAMMTGLAAYLGVHAFKPWDRAERLAFTSLETSHDTDAGDVRRILLRAGRLNKTAVERKTMRLQLCFETLWLGLIPMLQQRFQTTSVDTLPPVQLANAAHSYAALVIDKCMEACAAYIRTGPSASQYLRNTRRGGTDPRSRRLNIDLAGHEDITTHYRGVRAGTDNTPRQSIVSAASAVWGLMDDVSDNEEILAGAMNFIVCHSIAIGKIAGGDPRTSHRPVLLYRPTLVAGGAPNPYDNYARDVRAYAIGDFRPRESREPMPAFMRTSGQFVGSDMPAIYRMMAGDYNRNGIAEPAELQRIVTREAVYQGDRVEFLFHYGGQLESGRVYYSPYRAGGLVTGVADRYFTVQSTSNPNASFTIQFSRIEWLVLYRTSSARTGALQVPVQGQPPYPPQPPQPPAPQFAAPAGNVYMQQPAYYPPQAPPQNMFQSVLNPLPPAPANPWIDVYDDPHDMGGAVASSFDRDDVSQSRASPFVPLPGLGFAARSRRGIL